MRCIALLLFAAVLLPAAASAQGVPIKSIPVAEGDQFLFFPSERLAMGGVGIALDDRLYDPFVNPAKAVNLTGVNFISAPVYYGFGPLNNRSGEGSGRTLPVGALMNRDGFFGGALMAYQELVPAENRICCVWPVFNDVRQAFVDQPAVRSESDFSLNNLYVFGLGGAELAGNLSVGASVFHANLHGLEGVQRLYSAAGLRQDGTMQQYRLGLYHHWGTGHAADLVLMHYRLDMTHTMQEGVDDFREEYDKTQSFAVQAGYRHAFASGWTMGGRLAGDFKWHPKIPNYDLMNIPRDPGNSAAYNIGIGLATTRGAATFGVDIIYEPIWSHTWANAAEATLTVNDETIPAGEKTVDNRFDFSNARIRMGLQRDGERLDFSLGLDMHHISYDLDQMDFVDDERRLLDQHWTEWTVSGGLGGDVSGLRLQYMARLTLGTGTPGVNTWGGGGLRFADAAANWVVAPEGPLQLQETTILSHQLALVVPLAN